MELIRGRGIVNLDVAGRLTYLPALLSTQACWGVAAEALGAAEAIGAAAIAIAAATDPNIGVK